MFIREGRQRRKNEKLASQFNTEIKNTLKEYIQFEERNTPTDAEEEVLRKELKEKIKKAQKDYLEKAGLGAVEEFKSIGDGEVEIPEMIRKSMGLFDSEAENLGEQINVLNAELKENEEIRKLTENYKKVRFQNKEIEYNTQVKKLADSTSEIDKVFYERLKNKESYKKVKEILGAGEGVELSDYNPKTIHEKLFNTDKKLLNEFYKDELSVLIGAHKFKILAATLEPKEVEKALNELKDPKSQLSKTEKVQGISIDEMEADSITAMLELRNADKNIDEIADNFADIIANGELDKKAKMMAAREVENEIIGISLAVFANLAVVGYLAIGLLTIGVLLGIPPLAIAGGVILAAATIGIIVGGKVLGSASNEVTRDHKDHTVEALMNGRDDLKQLTSTLNAIDDLGDKLISATKAMEKVTEREQKQTTGMQRA